MTNILPDHANIEWLKKRAKRRKKEMIASGRAAQLSDAQFEIAREHGFSSWRSLASFFAQRDAMQSAPGADETDRFLADVAHGREGEVAAALEKDGRLKNAVGNHPFWGGRPQALHLCVEGNRADLFERLLEAGADASGSNAEYDFWSPLMLALQRHRNDMAQKLKDAGARVSICEALLAGDDDQLRVLSEALDDLSFPRPTGSLVALARSPFAIQHLLDLGFTVDDQDRWGSDAKDAISRLGPKGRELLEVLARHGHAQEPRDLARIGDVSALQDLFRENPGAVTANEVLIAAVDFGHVGLAEWLLDNGAEVNARQSHASRATALHSAAWNGDLVMVKYLLRYGADLDAVDEEHETTPLIWAQTALTVTNNPNCGDVADVLSALSVEAQER